jgi:putative ABC transport system permease protein
MRTTRFRFWRWLIALIGVIVPRRLRADWRQEWEAELQYRETLLAEWEQLNWRSKLDLLWHSLGAFMDALSLQPRRMEDEMFQDLRYGVRMLLKHKGFTLVAVLSLALGIGANTALFSLIEGILLRPLPYPVAERLTALWATKVDRGETQIPTSYPDWLSWSEQQRAFEGIGVFRNRPAFLQGRAEPWQAEFFETSANFFSLLNVPAAIGRTFLSADGEAGSQPVVVLSHNLWQHAFGSDQGVVGKSATFYDTSYRIIGVMPPSFVSPAISSMPGVKLSPSDAVWVLFKPRVVHQSRGNRGLRVIARLKPESTLAQAQAEMTTIANRLGEQYRDSNQGFGVRVVPLHEAIVGGTRQSLLILFGAVGLVLLIACGNVANLALARASVRQRELSLRAALGAGRLRLIRQLLTENLLLAALGGAVGLALAFWAVSLLRPLALPEIPRLETLQVNLKVLGFAAALSLLTSLLFGLAPALQTSKIELNETLKGGRQLTAGRSGNRFRHALMAVEVALSLVLLVGAGLLLQSFWRLQSAHGLHAPEKILTLQFTLAQSKYGQAPRTLTFYEEALERVRRIPGVQTVGLTTSLLQIGDPSGSEFEIEGRAPLAQTEKPLAGYTMVNSAYFSLAGIELRVGRLFTDLDRPAAPGVVVVNDALARLAFPGENPVGKRLKINALGTEPREIVGVVTDTQPYNLGVTARPRIYYPYTQGPSVRAIVMIRVSDQAAAIFPAVRAALRELDQTLPLFEVRTAREILAEATIKPRWSMALLTLFASVALMLAMVGIFGVVSYLVAQRTGELGIRMALGARPADVLKLIMGQNFKVIVVGILGGLVLTFALTRTLASLLFGVRTSDPATILGATSLLLAVAGCAGYLPARKAARVDPATALRHE